MTTSIFWYLCEKFKPLTTPFFNDIEAVFSCKGECISSDPISRVIKFEINGNLYYVKTYTHGGKNLRRYVGRSRVQAEWENLQFFKELGIPTPEIVAYGQDKQFGLFKRGAIITKAILNSTDLAILEREKSERLKDQNWIEKVGLTYYDYARRLHDNKFIHADLKWRNILVTQDDTPEIFFIDCPTGKKMFGPFFSHWRIKDLACLDKIARFCLEPSTRLKFFKAYLKTDKLSDKDKRFLKKITNFFPVPSDNASKSDICDL